MREYEDFLQKVKNEHPDEFNELQDIVNRYNTLHESNQTLQTKLDQLNIKKENMNSKTTTYVKEKKTEQMTITNKIGGLQKYSEQLEGQKSKIQSISEENKLKKVKATSDNW